MYVEQYWSESKRRVQASFVHYFILLKQTILCLVPANRKSLNATVEVRECCVELKEIEVRQGLSRK